VHLLLGEILFKSWSLNEWKQNKSGISQQQIGRNLPRSWCAVVSHFAGDWQNPRLDGPESRDAFNCGSVFIGALNEKWFVESTSIPCRSGGRKRWNPYKLTNILRIFRFDVVTTSEQSYNMALQTFWFPVNVKNKVLLEKHSSSKFELWKIDVQCR